ncbi:site-specific integrase [uncultured Alistipes sp.]|uniref:site-specific integrase n=1 Tax=uncultured Alistipes sp. TaxID=538949 RepID=UPI002636ED4C|nr:site-specific integrase [uncultured Alistipes sp.]
MATIKVKLRKSTVADKPATVYYQLSHRGERVQITTRMHLPPEEWDAAKGRPHPGTDRAAAVQAGIDGDVARIRRIVGQLERAGRRFALGEVVGLFRAPANGSSLTAFMRTQIEALRRCRRFGTAKNYERTVSSFSQFLAGAELPFEELTEELVGEYEAYLAARGVSRNSSSFYMRNLRAVYNKAVRLRLTPQNSPFEGVYTGVDRTRKRAVDSLLLAQLRRLDLSGDRALALARDLFLFSYCTRGIAFVDISFLRKSDVRDGAIRYVRRKTGQPLCIGIEPGIRELIDRYAEATRETPYVFPILTQTEALAAYRQYQAALSCHNRQLRKLSRLLSDDCRLTSYTARHSWATVARNCNVPLSVISAGLGHTTERTTQIYLAMLENSVIDTANRTIIGLLEG